MIQGELENLPKNISFHKTDCCNYLEMLKNLKGYDIVYHCAATAHEGLSVFSPNFITKNIYQANISVITASIVNKVKTIEKRRSIKVKNYGKNKKKIQKEQKRTKKNKKEQKGAKKEQKKNKIYKKNLVYITINEFYL